VPSKNKPRMTRSEMKRFRLKFEGFFLIVEMENEVDLDRPRPLLETVNVDEPGTEDVNIADPEFLVDALL
jgi:hypothetical protein